ncbi:MAG: NUDIX domain-containing protein [Anaerolineae bacterium]
MIEKAVASAILCNAQGEILLQLRDDKPGLRYPNYWTLFGGTIEDGETPAAGIHRELMEELKITLSLTYWKAFRCPVRSVEGTMTTYNHVFVGQMTQDIAHLTLLEGQAMRFFTRSQAKTLTLAFEQHLILNEWINTHD